MVMPPMDMNIYIPDPLAVVELNLGDHWRGRWVETDELPDGAPTTFGYVVVCMADKGYLTREKGTDRFGVVGGTFEAGEKPAAWLKRVVLEQTGATPGRTQLLGYFDCRATSHNPDYEAGAATVRPVYLVSAKAIKDLGAKSRFERRRMPMNEFAVEVRKRHPEVDAQLQAAINIHMTLHLRGEV
ncbi:MAG: hypothetical protein IT302_00020 [Dehalococcoidia bacterium]|nr:hypothetical protein [Dehalococcoidia bacterium]